MSNKYIRKSQKKQIEDVLEVLNQAHDAVKKALDTGNREIALSLLEQSQDSAIQIGGMIEESFGEDFATVGLLENYCEQLYQTYELIRQKQPVNAVKIYKNLRKELIRIENSAKNDMPVRTTAVFLPYKASMWDSLESVWKAADEDPNCDAYVVPIPYFDKNPDGSFREIHYEGNDYPSYVPITSWEEYDIAAEHPDMVFIHNPYDEFNHVTSVHPAYYSKELKKQTDLLVYIPYYILKEIDPNNKAEVENIEHFCTVPAVVHADRVIVQSKDWRRIYIDVMTRTMGNDTRRVWEEKILGLGSPKLDKVHSTGMDDLEIPKEWLKVIEKPDGSWKKIIFYNTSVSALLKYEERMLKKLEYVFDFFKKNQNETVLLWRPHPLIKATIESMRPQLWKDYENIVQTYIEEGWGIYDDTADINRAIAISDAYYGDPSSVVQMYEETGKPIMMQRVEITTDGKGNIMEENKLNLHFESYVRMKDKVYFSESFFNGLFELDLNDYSVRFLCHFSNERKNRILLHGAAAQYENKLFFFPMCGRQIHCYDLINQKESRICIPIGEDKAFIVIRAIQRGKKVWLFSADSSMKVFIFNMEDQSVERAEILSELLEKYKPLAGVLDVAEEKKVFSYCKDKSMVLEIDIENSQIKEYKPAIDNSNVYLMGYYMGGFYFQDVTTGDCYEWDSNKDSMRKLKALDLESNDSGGLLFSGCRFVNGNIYLIPWKNKFVLKSDEGVLKKAFDYPEDLQRFHRGETHDDFVPGVMKATDVVGHKIWLYPYGTNQLLIYDVKTDRVEEKRITLEVDRVFPCEGAVYEYDTVPLEYFYYGIRKNEKKSVSLDKSLGGIIYKAVNKL